MSHECIDLDDAEGLGLLFRFNKRLNLTIVLITHEMHVGQARLCNKVAVMDDGKCRRQEMLLEVLSKKPQQDINENVLFARYYPDSGETDEVLEEML